MNKAHLEAHIANCDKLYTEMVNYQSGAAISTGELILKLTEVKRLYRFAEGKKQSIYLSNLADATEALQNNSLPVKTILQTITADLEIHMTYLLRKYAELTPKTVDIADAIPKGDKPPYPKHLAHILEALDKQRGKQ